MATVILIKLNNKESLNEDDKISIVLPAVLGRGSLLRCSEKKVSRNHASLDWDDDGLLITSTHTNPTFLHIGKKEESLNSGETAVLHDGDKFGLLENSAWYMINLNSPNNNNTVKVPSSSDSLKGKSDDANPEVISNSKSDITPDNIENLKDPVKKVSTKLMNSLGRMESKKTLPGQAINKKIFKDIWSEECEVSSDKRNDEVAIKNKVAQLPVVPKEDLTDVKCDKQNNSQRQRKLPSWMSQKGESSTSKINEDKGVNDSPIKPKKTNIRKQKNQTKKKGPVKNAAALCHEMSLEYDQNNVATLKENLVSEKKTTNIDKNDANEIEHYDKTNMPAKNPQRIAVDALSDSDEGGTIVSPLKTNAKNADALSDSDGGTTVSPLKTNAKNVDTLKDSDEGGTTVSPLKTNAKNADALSDSDDEMTQSKKDKPLAVGGDDPSVQQLGATPVAKAIAVSPEKEKRDACEFGSSCYRKNPQHRKHLSHPGDSDYESPKEEDEDERPECEYGVKCFRKNPKHKREFKHTRQPQPKRRVKKKARLDDDDALNDDYDYDDPFFNDESSDDYDPTDSDSDYEMDSDVVDGDSQKSDHKRLMKEAKRFKKGK